MARIIGEVEPTYAFIENSPLLRIRGLGVVLQDLAKMGYDAAWGVLGAADVGANHQRDRMWIVAKSTNANASQLQRRSIPIRVHPENTYVSNSRWWEVEPNVGRVADGMANRVDRLKAIGNGQVPICAATAFKQLKAILDN